MPKISRVMSTLLLLLPTLASAAPPTFQQISAAEQSLDSTNQSAQRASFLVDLATRNLPPDTTPELAAATKNAEAATARLESAIEAAKLTDLRQQLRDAQKARTDAIDSLVKESPRLLAAATRLAELRSKIAASAPAIATLTPEQQKEIAALEFEANRLEALVAKAKRACWTRGEVEDAYKKADALYKKYNDAAAKDPGIKAANQTLNEARFRVEEQQTKIVQTLPAYAPLIQALNAANTARESASTALADLRKPLIEGGKTFEVDVPQPPAKDGKPRPPQPATLWIPNSTSKIRAIILGHPPMLGTSVPMKEEVRTVAALDSLAILNFKNLDALFTYTTDSPERLQKTLDALAEKSKHPELASAPFITVGHSTSGIFCRNIAYWKPDRTLAVVHLKSGNFHQHRPDPARTFATVPLLAINGEFEEFGPEGGIRKEYGNQTQWLLVRAQLLAFRSQDPHYLVSLIAEPAGSHTSWSTELSRYTALFIHKAATLGLNPDGSVKKLKAEDGWLTDAHLDNPAHPAAPYDKYTGDKSQAFWHFDEELTKANEALHKNRLLLEDPTQKSPVPSDWIGLKLKN